MARFYDSNEMKIRDYNAGESDFDIFNLYK